VLLQEGQDWTAAEQALRDVVQREPGHAESWKNLVVLLKDRGREPEALAACRDGLEQMPNDAELLMLRGMLEYARGDFPAAEVALRWLLATLPPDDSVPRARLLRSRGRHYLAMRCRAGGRDFEAEAHWCASLAEFPDYVPAREALADLYLRQGRWADLEQVLARLDEFPGARADAAVLRARVHLARREFAAARRLLEDVVALAPEHLEARVYLTYTLLQEGRDWDAAERALRDLLALDPDNAEARQNLNVLLRQQGRPPVDQ
jgi:tetratricopeptide (TPR) repeat protein